MDQFASMMCKQGHAILLDCRSLEYSYFPLDLGRYELLLLDTNVSHDLATSEYNNRRAECEAGVAILQAQFPAITHLRDVSLEQLNSCRAQLPEHIYRRCLHVISENARVTAATEALSSGNHQVLGRLIYQSHYSLQHHYEVSCPELDFLVQQTVDRPYVLGARMMGGGFGGSTLNIVEKSKRDAFVEAVAAAYQAQFGLSLTPYSVSIEDGVGVVS
jgi:galactokinase